MSYANKLKTNKKQYAYPHANQGIVMENIKEIHLEEYLLELQKIVEPQKIHSASRMSNKIYIFFSDKQTTDNFIEQHKIINVLNNKITISKYTDYTKKIIISNCLPMIPNSIIEQKLTELGIQLASSINILRIGTRYDAFKHILSFRRLTYIIPNDKITLPEHLNIEYNNKTHKIYLMEDSQRCSYCNRQGHNENECHQTNIQQETNEEEEPNNVIHLTTTPSENATQKKTQQKSTQEIEELQQIKKYFNNLASPEQPKPDQENLQTNITTNEISQEPFHNKKQTIQTQSSEQQLKEQMEEVAAKYELIKQQYKEKQTENHTHEQVLIENTNESPTLYPTTKRPALNSHSSEENLEQNTPNKKLGAKPKKQRSLSPKTDINEQMEEIKIELDKNSDKYALNYDQLQDFIENAQGHKDIAALANEYTTDTDQLIKTLDKLYKILQNSKIKNRFTRIIKKLQINQNKNDNPSMEY